jgi:hypothetical protein
MPKPNLGPLYGAAFGFNTDRRVKPVHFATGYFLAVTGKNYKQRDLNYTVALPARKEPEGKYAIEALHDHLKEAGKIDPSLSHHDLHSLRIHLQAVADNDDAVYPMFGKKPGFGSDYSASSARLVSRTKDNDGFLGQFVKSILELSEDGREILHKTEEWLSGTDTTSDRLLAPLLDGEAETTNLAEQAEAKLGPLDQERAQRISILLASETKAVCRLCSNCDSLPVEAKLRYLIIALSFWVTSYLRRVTFKEEQKIPPLLVDMTGGKSIRMREQSQWSYTRFRECVIAYFMRLAEAGAFEQCQTAWDYVRDELDGRPKVEEFFRELLIRNGLAQPRGGRVNTKHFELQPDTLAVITLTLMLKSEEPVALPEFFERMYNTWGLCIGGRTKDADVLAAHGYSGIDEKSDLIPNVEATTNLLSSLGLARRYSDGLVLCDLSEFVPTQ